MAQQLQRTNGSTTEVGRFADSERMNAVEERREEGRRAERRVKRRREREESRRRGAARSIGSTASLPEILGRRRVIFGQDPSSTATARRSYTPVRVRQGDRVPTELIT